MRRRNSSASRLRLWSSAILIAGGFTLAAANACTTDATSELSPDDDSNSGSGGGFAQGGGLGVGSGGNGFGGGCAAEVFGGEGAPLDMYIMLDKSGSMSDSNKWSNVTSAISSFMANSQSAGIGVGIQFFPYDTGAVCPLQCETTAQCGVGCGACNVISLPGFPPIGVCDGADSCEIGDYSTPQVAIAELPGVATAIDAAMSAEGPTGGTPTAPALEGAIQYAQNHATANPAHNVIVVLATDGDPSSCAPTDIPGIRAIAEAGANGSPSILTFVIGVGDLEDNLNQLAMGGGTNNAYMVDAGGNVEQQFLDALEAIKGQALGCSYNIPLPTNGEEPNFGQVNVVYTPGGGSGETIPYVAGPGQCPSGGDGWYYNDPQNPTQILLCPHTCQRVDGDQTGQIEVVLGCATVPL